MRGDLILSRRRNQHIAIQLQQLRIADVFRAAIALKRASRLQILQSRSDVDTGWVMNTTMHVRYPDHPITGFMKELRGDTANVAAALHDHASVRRRHLESLNGLAPHTQQPSPRGFAPPPPPPQ